MESEANPPVYQSQNRKNIALTALLLGASATAINPVFVRLSELDPLASAFHRMAWALPILWAWFYFQNRITTVHSSRRSIRDRWLLILCGLFFSADLIALHWSIQLTAVANAILFLNAQPIYVVFGAWLLFREQPSQAFVIGSTVALLGAVFMVEQSISFNTSRLVGDGLGILAGIFYACFILTASQIRSRTTSAEINLWTVSIACPFLLITALFGGQTIFPTSMEGWFLMVGLGVISQALGQGLIVWGFAYLATSFSSVALMAAPVAASMFAWIFLGELISTQQILGMGLVMIGIYLCNRANIRQTLSPDHQRHQHQHPGRFN